MLSAGTGLENLAVVPVRAQFASQTGVYKPKLKSKPKLN